MKKTITCLCLLLFFSVNSYASNWMHESKKDPMRDTISCAVTLTNKSVYPAPIIVVFPDGAIITAVAKLYPGKEIAVRVDKNEPKSGQKMISGNNADLIFEEIRGGGKQMLFQIQQWPKGILEYFTVDLEGLIEHYDACQQIVKE